MNRCDSCKREIFSSHSNYCVACGAALTLQYEIRQDWGCTVLKGLGTDLALTAARQVRALRLQSLKIAEERSLAAPVVLRPKEEKEVEEPRPSRAEGSTRPVEETPAQRPPLGRRKTVVGDSLSSSYLSENTAEEEDGFSPKAGAGEKRLPEKEASQEGGLFPKSLPCPKLGEGTSSGARKQSERGAGKEATRKRVREEDESSSQDKKRRREVSGDRKRRKSSRAKEKTSRRHKKDRRQDLLPERLLQFNIEDTDKKPNAPRKEQWRTEKRKR